jgi:hypothetical protein
VAFRTSAAGACSGYRRTRRFSLGLLAAALACTPGGKGPAASDAAASRSGATPGSSANAGRSSHGAASADEQPAGRGPGGESPRDGGPPVLSDGLAVEQPCGDWQEVVLTLPSTWYYEPRQREQGYRSGDLSLDADATGSVIWLAAEDSRYIWEFKQGRPSRRVGPIEDGVVDARALRERNFLLLHEERRKLTVYDARTRKAASRDLPGAVHAGAVSFLTRGPDGMYWGDFQDTTRVTDLRGTFLSDVRTLPGIPAPDAATAVAVALHGHSDVTVVRSSPANSSAAAELSRREFSLGEGVWQRRGLVFDSAGNVSLVVSRGAERTRERVQVYEQVFLVGLDASGAPRSMRELTPSDASPPIRRSVVPLTDGKLLQLATDARGVSVHRFDPAKAPAHCRANPGPAIADAKEFEAAPTGKLRGGDALGCQVRRILGWLQLVCQGSSAPRSISLENAFAADFRIREAVGSDLRVNSNGLTEDLVLASAPRPFVELIVRFTRGTRVRGRIYWPQEWRRFDLVWTAQEVDPQWVGAIYPPHPLDNAG